MRCPKCKTNKTFHNCEECNIEWKSNEIKQEDRLYEIAYNNKDNKNVIYKSKHIESICDLKYSLSESISEKNEYIFARMFTIKKILGGDFKKIIISTPLWNEILQYNNFSSDDKKIVIFRCNETELSDDVLLRFHQMWHVHDKYWIYFDTEYGSSDIRVINV